MKEFRPINTSIFDFPTLIQKECVYVDKTAQIYEIAKPSADEMCTSGRFDHLLAEPDRRVLTADGRDAMVVNLTALDADGHVVFDACDRVFVSVSGAGEIIGIGNGGPLDHEADVCPKNAWTRKLFNGRAQVVVRAGDKPGDVTLSAAGERTQKSIVTLTTR